MIKINSMEEMKKYFVDEDNTYVFNDDVEFRINIETTNSIKAHKIKAYVIKAHKIVANDIDAWDIRADDIRAYDIVANNIFADDIIAKSINAKNILYYAICITRHSFECESVNGRRENSIHKCLDDEIKYNVDKEE